MTAEEIEQLIVREEEAAKACHDEGDFDQAVAHEEYAELWRQRLARLRDDFSRKPDKGKR